MISDRLPFSYHKSYLLVRLSDGRVSVGIAYTEQRRELHRASYSALIQLCRVIFSRLVEPYCSQSLNDEYCLLSSTFAFRRL